MTDPIIPYSAAILVGALVFAQLVIEILARRRPNKDLNEVRIRVRSWWIILVLIEGALYLGKWTTLFFFASVSFFALREYLSRVPTRVCDRKVLFWVLLAIPLQFALISQEWIFAFVCFVPVYSISILAFRLLLTGEPKGFVMAMATYQLGLMSTVYSVGHLAYLPFLRPGRAYELEAGSVLFVIGVTQLNDVFQFISGKTLGRRKIMPLISPKKTVEGFLGGVVLSSALSAGVAPYLTPLTHVEGIAAGACLSMFGFLGDVLMSAIKRDLQIKDFSQIIPGHGGVLDRIDSLTLSAPLYFHLLRVILIRGGAL